MKIVLIVLGILAAAYTVFAVVQLINLLSAPNTGSTYGVGQMAGGVLAVCLGLIVCLACFQQAFKKADPKE